VVARSVRATEAERRRSLPGDDLIRDPLESFTHAITIRGVRREVWPWIVQMGATRGGWYSYDFIDNRGARSAERIVTELQDISVGSLMPAVAGATDGFFVLRLEPERALVLGWVPPRKRTPLTTWAFRLEDAGPDRTRLIVRARAASDYRLFGLPRWILRRLVPVVHSVMERRQLLGIARRVEGDRAGRAG